MKKRNFLKKNTLRMIFFILMLGSVYLVTLTQAAMQISVAVQGAVKSPGIYQLPANSRMVDLLGRAKASENADLLAIDMAQILKNNDKIVIPAQENNSSNQNYREYQNTTIYNNQRIKNNKVVEIEDTEINENIVDNRSCNKASTVAKTQLLNLNTATEKNLIDRFGKYGMKIEEALNIVAFRQSQNTLKITSVCQLIDAQIIYASLGNIIVNEVYILP